MPNWCCANWFLKGPKEKIQSFADTVNSLPNKESVAPNGFGCFWLPNLACSLGLIEKDDIENPAHGNLRGVVDPDPYACACWTGPDPDPETRIEVVEQPDASYSIRFSTVSAWDIPKLFLKYFDNLDGCEYGYMATDEFGSFHKRTPNCTDDIYDVGGSAFDCWESFSEGEEKEFLKHVSKAVDLGDIDKLLSRKDWIRVVNKKVEEYNKTNTDLDVIVDIYEVSKRQ